jgi:hypothetical protein
MRCRLCELFTDQLQTFSFNHLHSIPNQLHHYHQHMSAATSSTFLLPQMRDMIAACLLRGRNASWCSNNVCQCGAYQSHCILYQRCTDSNVSCFVWGGGVKSGYEKITFYNISSLKLLFLDTKFKKIPCAHHEAMWGNGGILPLILNLGTYV